MNFLESLTDMGLRKIFKFTLNRLMGRYLEDALFLDQLAVNWRDGLLKTSNLVLNSETLNADFVEPTGAPFKIKKISVGSLEIMLSYNLLVGCQLTLRDLEIFVEPNVVCKTTPEATGLPSDSSPKSSGAEIPVDKEYAGLEYAANWIEAIIANLKLDVENVVVIALDPNSPNSTRLTIKIANSSFFNTKPNASLNAKETASSISTDESVPTKKLLRMSNLSVNLSTDSEDLNIVSLQNDFSVEFTNSTVDVVLSAIDVRVRKEAFEKLGCFLASFTPKATPEKEKEVENNENNSSGYLESLLRVDPTVGTLLWLEKQQRLLTRNNDEVANGKDDLDFNKLIEILKEQLQSRQNIQSESLTGDTNDAAFVSEDIDTSSDSEVISTSSLSESLDIGESKFVDALEGRSHLSVEKMSRSSSKYVKTHIRSKSSYVTSSTTMTRTSTIFQLNVTMNKIVCDFDGDDGCSLIVDVGKSTFYYETSSAMNNIVENSFSLSMHELGLFERLQTSVDSIDIPWITFTSSVEGIRPLPRLLFQSKKSKTSKTIYEINVDDLVASVHLSRMTRWVEKINDAVSKLNYTSASEPTSTPSITINIPEANLLLHTEENIDIDEWTDFLKSLDDNVASDKRWERMDVLTSQNASYVQSIREHLLKSKSRGGLRLQGKDISIKLINPDDKGVEEEGIQLGILTSTIFLQNKDFYEESLFLSAFRDPCDPSSKIKIQNSSIHDEIPSLSNSDSYIKLDEDGGILYGDEGALRPPHIDKKHVLHLYAYRIAIDVRHREFCSLITISNFFAPRVSPKNFDDECNIEADNEKKAFGVHFHASVATIRLSENDSKTESVEALSLSLAVLDPVIQVLTVNQPKQQTFLSVEADDVAMYEMTSTQYESTFSRRDYSKKQHNTFSRRSKVGEMAHLVPFLHRTTLHAKSGKWNVDHVQELLFDADGNSLENNEDKILVAKKSDHAFRIQLLLSQGNLQEQDEISKSVSIHMSFQDVTIRYVPSSTWLMKVADLLTPLSPKQILERQGLLSPSDIDQREQKPTSKVIFEVTKINFRVRKCLVDYCCTQAPSRLLFTVGLLEMTSLIISNNPKFSMKFTVRDIALHLSNRLEELPEYEQSPLDPDGHRSSLPSHDAANNFRFRGVDWVDMETFLDVHLFVLLLTLDHLETLLTFHDDEAHLNIPDEQDSSSLSLRIDVGHCCLYACIDSIAVFSDTMLYWWLDFKKMIDEAETLSKQKNTSNRAAKGVNLPPSILLDQSRKLTLDDLDNDKRILKKMPNDWLKNVQMNAFSPQVMEYSTSEINKPLAPEFQTRWLPPVEHNGSNGDDDSLWEDATPIDDDEENIVNPRKEFADIEFTDERSVEKENQMTSSIHRIFSGDEYEDSNGAMFEGLARENVEMNRSYYSQAENVDDSNFDVDADIDDIIGDAEELLGQFPMQSTTYGDRSQIASSLHISQEQSMLKQSNKGVAAAVNRVDDPILDHDHEEDYEVIRESPPNVTQIQLDIAVPPSEKESSRQGVGKRIPGDNVDTDNARQRTVSHEYEEFTAEYHVKPKDIPVVDTYFPIPPSSFDHEHNLPEFESKLTVTTFLRVSASIRLRLFGGADWSDSPRPLHNFHRALPPENMPGIRTESKSTKSSLKKHRTKQVENSVHFQNLVKNSETSEQKRRNATLFDQDDGQSFPGKVASKPTTVKSRSEVDMLDVTVSNLNVCLRLYAPTTLDKGETNTDEKAPKVPPIQRLSARMEDFLVSFQRQGYRKKKVLGWWRSQNVPRSPDLPIVNIIMVGYSTTCHSSGTAEQIDDNVEHRVLVNILPLRCFFDPYLVKFLKQVGEAQSAIDKKKVLSSQASENKSSMKKSDNTIYFQMISIKEFEIKIDYYPGGVDLEALRAGDYLQLLNFFPLEGLTVTLKKVRLTGISGGAAVMDKAIRAWVEDIYQNQLHRVISGTTPFRGIASIGSEVRDLVLIPMKEYQKKNQNTAKMLRDVQKQTTSLLSTITRETLHVTQRLTMLVAKGIAELASDSPDDPPSHTMKTRSKSEAGMDSRQHYIPFGPSEKIASTSTVRATRQPATFNEGLAKAYESIKREADAFSEAIIAIPIREYRRTGSQKAMVKTVISNLPVAIMRPIAGTAEGISYTLLGLRNYLDPNLKFEEEEIWNVDK